MLMPRILSGLQYISVHVLAHMCYDAKPREPAHSHADPERFARRGLTLTTLMRGGRIQIPL